MIKKPVFIFWVKYQFVLIFIFINITAHNFQNIIVICMVETGFHPYLLHGFINCVYMSVHIIYMPSCMYTYSLQMED